MSYDGIGDMNRAFFAMLFSFTGAAFGVWSK
jgi:hypothetical protein